MKSLSKLAALACGTVSVGALAQSDIRLYGVIDQSVGRFQDAGSDSRMRLESGKLFTSFFGMGGSEDLGGGLKAVFALESFFRADTGEPGRYNSDSFFSRAANVGLSGDFGALRLGRQSTPTRAAAGRFDPFGGSTGFSPAIRQVFSPNASALRYFGDTAWNNAVGYSTNSYGGLAASVMGSFGEQSSGSFGNNIGGNVAYYSKSFSGALAFQRVKNGASGVPAGFKHQDTLELSAAYDFAALKVFGQVGKVSTRASANTHTSIYNVGLTMPIGAGKVLAQYGNATSHFAAADATNKTLTVGYDYFLSKRTDVYLIGMSDRFTGKNSGTTLAAGIRHGF
ncbi:porin [Xylophilus sp. ASV27]|uniref:porin n=1 Tax=Xylophilus sp. ASV27 TaxID=2795129 RepID=UPI0018EBD5E9|nr:porin [Xylophilus sp. ASV27]